MANPKPVMAYFITGHGENDPTDSRDKSGYSKLAAMLKNELNCGWDRLSLAGTNVIPADCQLLIVAAGPQEGRMFPEELDKISAYLKGGGRMLALLTRNSGLETVLGGWGVELGDANNRIRELDKNLVQSETGDAFLTAFVSREHFIMTPLAVDRMFMFMVYPRWVNEARDRPKLPGQPTVTVLAATSEKAVNQLGRAANFPLLVAVEQGGIKDVDTPGGRGTRIVVAGDSDFLDDQVIEYPGNTVFAKRALGWLLQRPEATLSGLGPAPIRQYKLYMTDTQTQGIRWLFLAGLPGSVLLVGGLVWLRRRS